MRNSCASDGLLILTWNEIFSGDKNYEQSLQESLCKNYFDTTYARIILVLHSTGIRFSLCAKPYGAANYYS
jgi:hypothetical protein